MCIAYWKIYIFRPIPCTNKIKVKTNRTHKMSKFLRLWFLKFTHHGRSVLDVFFTDKERVHKSGYINSQSYRIWSNQVGFSFHHEKIGIWCAISQRSVIESIFFHETANAKQYQNIIKQFIALLEHGECYTWFQQDGAKAHTAASIKEFLTDFFNERIILWGLWPPRSPVLIPTRFSPAGLH